MRQTIMIDDIEEINIPVVVKIGVQSEAEQTVVSPAAYFITDIKKWLCGFDAVLNNPDAAAPFPNVHSVIGRKCQPNRFVPRAAQLLFGEIWRQGRRSERKNK